MGTLHTLKPRGPLVDFGSFRNLFHQGRFADDLSIGLSFWTGAEYDQGDSRCRLERTQGPGRSPWPGLLSRPTADPRTAG
jgi:hypothetical protein